MLRGLILFIVIAAAAWSGAWVFQAKNWEHNLTTWMEERRAEGWQADWSTVEVRGFPNRLDTTISDVALADTQAGWAWTAPFVQMFALVYTQQDLIVVLPRNSVLQTPHTRYALQGDDIRASLSLDGDSLTLQRVTAVMEGVSLTQDGQDPWSAGQLRVAAERKAADPTGYRLGLAMADVVAPRGLGPTDARASVQADLSMWFDAPWDRMALETARPQPTRIRVDGATIQWGELEMRVAGDLDIARGGTPQGRLTVKLVNWQEVLDLAVQSGAVPRDLSGPIATALRLASGLAGRSDTLDVPLDLRRGRIFLGPLSLGDAPQLRIR